MKNKIKKFNIFIINKFYLLHQIYVISEEINFEANSIELIDKDNRIIAKKK